MDADSSHPTINYLKKMAELISIFVTPLGLVGGEFASRSTTYVLPFGIIEAAYTSPVLASRFARIDLLKSYEKLDDRYLMHYCLPSLAMAALQLERRGPPDLSGHDEDTKWSRMFDQDAHIYACQRDNTVIFIGANKGGAFHIEDRGITYTDCGFRIERSGDVYATCVLDEDPEISISEDAGTVAVRIRAPFQRYGTLVASSSKTVLLRLLRFLGPTFNSYFKKTLIRNPQTLKGVHLNRCLQIDFEKNELTVDDTIDGMDRLDNLTISPSASLRLVPSAKFYQAGEEESFLRSLETPSLDNRHRRVIPLSGSPIAEVQNTVHE